MENQRATVWIQRKESGSLHFIFLFKDFIYLFLEKGKGREKGRKTLMCERNIDWLPQVPTRDLAATEACGLTRSWTRDLLVCRMTPNPLNHTSQGLRLTFYSLFPFLSQSLTYHSDIPSIEEYNIGIQAQNPFSFSSVGHQKQYIYIYFYSRTSF